MLTERGFIKTSCDTTVRLEINIALNKKSLSYYTFTKDIYNDAYYY